MQQEGGASARDFGPDEERAAVIAAQRAAADAAIAAVAGGRQTLAAMTTATAAAVKSAGTVESKREAERAALEAEDAEEAEESAEAAEAEQPDGAEAVEAGAEEPAGLAGPAEADQGPETDETAAAGPAAAPFVPRPANRIRPAAKQPIRQDAPLPELGEDVVSRWLAAEGAPDSFRRLLYAEFGEGAEAAERLAGNPWLVLELPGVQPALVDRLAAVLAGPQSGQIAADPRRGRALVGWNLRRAAQAGHTAVPADEMARALGSQVPDPAGAIADAVEHGAALVFADRIAAAAAGGPAAGADEDAEFEAVDTADDDDPASMLTSPYTLLALDRWTFAEQSAAEAVQRLLATATPLEPKQQAAAPGGAGAEWSARVVEQAALSGLTLVTGADADLPGRVAAAFPGAVLTSPSPAGLRTQAGLGHAAVDLRVLSEDYSGPFEQAEVVVVADAHLLPLELGVELLELLPDGAHLVLSGDPGSLPAAGPGRLFRDLLEIDDPEFGGRVPRVELKARPTGPLRALVDAVRYGGLPPVEILGDATSNEVKIIPVRDPAETRLRTVQLLTDSIPRALGFGGGQVQAIAIREQGPAGAQDLNAAVKERVNPGPGVCGGLDAGDRVVVREGGRLAEFGLLGGETGTVVAAHPQGLTLRVDEPARAARPADGEPGDTVELDAGQARALRHAWVLTLREAQGGRWPAVVAVLDGGSAAALTRSAVLGAFAAADNHLSVVHGAGPALAEAVEKRPHVPCRTRLAQALRS